MSIKNKLRDKLLEFFTYVVIFRVLEILYSNFSLVFRNFVDI